MASNEHGGSNRTLVIGLFVALVVLAGLGGWAAARLSSDPAALISGADRRAIEAVVRNYILENPEVIPEAMENLHRKENVKALANVRNDVEKPFPGAVLGNPDGKVTLVEFSDFACGYCRASVADVKQLLAAHPDLRIVMREFPILSEESAIAARMALAAGEQGKYAAFHDAMFAAGRLTPATIDAAARGAGLDLAKARQAASSKRIEEELARNMSLGRDLGFSGTPSWVVGDQLISGAVGADALAKAIADARS